MLWKYFLMSANCPDALTHSADTTFAPHGVAYSKIGQETFKELGYIAHVKLGFQNPF